MKKKIRVLEMLHGFLLISMVYDLIIQAAKPGSWEAVYKNILLLPVVAAVSAACRRVKHFWQFFLVSTAAIAGVVWAGGGNTEAICLGVCTCLTAVSFFTARAKKESCWLEAPSYAWLLGYVILFLESMYFHNDFLEGYLAVKAAAYFLLCNFHVNLIQMEEFVKNHSSLERFPMKRLGRTNQGMMWIFNGIIAAAMIVSPFLGIDGMIRKLGQACRQILVWIIQLIFRGGEQEEMILHEQANPGMMMPPGGEKEIPLFLEILYQILDVLGWIFALVLVLAVLWMVIRKIYLLYRNFNVRTEENGDRVERMAAPVRKEKKKKLSREKKENLFWDSSVNGRIRKYYKKRVIHELGREIPLSYTPSQVERDLSMSEEEKRKFHVCYEKARYGREECSRKELEEMHKI